MTCTSPPCRWAFWIMQRASPAFMSAVGFFTITSAQPLVEARSAGEHFASTAKKMRSKNPGRSETFGFFELLTYHLTCCVSNLVRLGMARKAWPGLRLPRGGRCGSAAQPSGSGTASCPGGSSAGWARPRWPRAGPRTRSGWSCASAACARRAGSGRPARTSLRACLELLGRAQNASFPEFIIQTCIRVSASELR